MYEVSVCKNIGVGRPLHLFVNNKNVLCTWKTLCCMAHEIENKIREWAIICNNIKYFVVVADVTISISRYEEGYSWDY